MRLRARRPSAATAAAASVNSARASGYEDDENIETLARARVHARALASSIAQPAATLLDRKRAAPRESVEASDRSAARSRARAPAAIKTAAAAVAAAA